MEVWESASELVPAEWVLALVRAEWVSALELLRAVSETVLALVSPGSALPWAPESGRSR